MAGPSALSFIGMIIMAMMMIVRNGDDDVIKFNITRHRPDLLDFDSLESGDWAG